VCQKSDRDCSSISLAAIKSRVKACYAPINKIMSFDDRLGYFSYNLVRSRPPSGAVLLSLVYPQCPSSKMHTRAVWQFKFVRFTSRLVWLDHRLTLKSFLNDAQGTWGLDPSNDAYIGPEAEFIPNGDYCESISPSGPVPTIIY